MRALDFEPPVPVVDNEERIVRLLDKMLATSCQTVFPGLSGKGGMEHTMVKEKDSNVHWHQGQITRTDRERSNGHRGLTLWFTGIPASGKSTLAVAVERALHKRNCHTYILDGDNIRHGLNKDLGFSPEDRTENIRRIGEVANLLRDCGIINLVAFISPYRSDRQGARELSNHDGTFL